LLNVATEMCGHPRLTCLAGRSLRISKLSTVIWAYCSWVATLMAVPEKVCPSAHWRSVTACGCLIGSLITSCMGTPLIAAGSGGPCGSVPNGVLGLAAESATVRSYCGNGGAEGTSAAAVSLSEEPRS
jgi:hypothetical protein